MSSSGARRAAQPSETTPLLAPAAVNDAQETQLSEVGSRKPVSPARQIAPDLLRGLLMAFMAIDHTSLSVGAYAHGTGVVGESASQLITEWNNDLAYTLRLLSHLCAPGFTMLLGMGVAFFTQSRLAQGLQPIAFAKHFTLRALAIVLVNTLAFAALLVKAPHIILNAVMWALAIDYLVVGALCVAIVFVVEPLLSGAIRGVLDSGKTHASTSRSTSDRQAAVMAHHIINSLLLVLATVVLWSNIWTSPNQGDCRAASVSPSQWGDPSPHCDLDRHFFFDLIFRSVSCPNLHIVSGFPPVGWLPFALFGLLYGRILIHGPFKSTLAVTAFNGALSVVSALLFVSTRLLQFGNLSTHCLATPDQARQTGESPNQYLASLKSFLYVSKYPPSPAFAFLTLAACYLLLALFSASTHIDATSKLIKSRFNPLLVYGNQPLFFYGVHLFLLMLVSQPIINSRLAHPLPAWSSYGRGVGLGWTFLIIYLLTLAVMYIACFYYSVFKRRSGRESLWRFL